MKILFLLSMAALNYCILSQEDPNKFFPSSVGNVWIYGTSQGNFRYEIIKDSIDSEGLRYLFYHPEQPSYKLDTSYNVFYVPYNLNWLYYKLNADSGNIWIVDQRIEEDTTYMLAVVRNKYASVYLGRATTILKITFYDYQPDTIINEFSWPRFTEYLAYGLGEILYFDEEGGGPQRNLLGCIIDGDTIGTITGVFESDKIPPFSFELFQNYPNPFNPTTTISYYLPYAVNVNLKIYNILSEEITTLVDDYENAGNHSVKFKAKGLSSGIYIYRIEAISEKDREKFIHSKLMVFVK